MMGSMLAYLVGEICDWGFRWWIWPFRSLGQD